MPETVKFDHYEVLTRDDGSLYELGRGAMGITYKAFDTNLRIPVALKVINTRLLNSDVARQRFIREARSAAKLRHRHVASVFHLGTDSETYFYAMEFIDGETVEALIRRTGPQPPLTALRIALQVAKALSAAEQHGLVHRDIKPANLMLVREDDELCVKVIDFGLVKATEADREEDGAALSMGGFFGTPHFASPEQLLEKQIDIRSDIYSLGATLWYMLAGQAPFAGSIAEVMGAHISSPPPIEKLDQLPPALEALLRRMLAKDPADRPQSASALRLEIDQCVDKVAGGPAAAAARAAIDDEAFATVLDDSTARASHASFSPGTVVGGRYEIIKELAESNIGAQFQARDQSQCDLRLVALNRKLVISPTVFARLQHDAEKLHDIEHPNLLRIYGVETVNGEGLLLLEWTNGFSLLDILRARRELPATEVLPLLKQIAEGIDFALEAGVRRLDLGLHQILVHFPSAADPQRNLLRASVETWPEAIVKVNPLDVAREQSLSETWSGGQTMTGSFSGNSRNAVAASVLQTLGRVVYELLGGTLPAMVMPGFAPRYVPLTTLSEAGNAVMKRTFNPTESFSSVSEFVAALAESMDHAGSIVAEPLPPEPAAQSAAGQSTATQTSFPTRRLSAPVPVTLPPPIVSSARPLVQPAPLPVAPSPTPTQPATKPHPEPAGKAGAIIAIGAIAAVLVLGAGAYFIVPRFLGTHTTGGLSTPTPAPTPAYVHNNNTGQETKDNPPAEAAPAPVPTRQEQLQKAVKRAGDTEQNGDIAATVATWNGVAREYPEAEIGRLRLEMFLDSFRNRKAKLTGTESARLISPLTEAANLGVVGAMMLLADCERETSPADAFRWYSQAATKGLPEAFTQVGLMLSNGRGTERDLPKAAESFQTAMDHGDSAATGLLAECYLLGKGVPKDEKHAIELLDAAARKGDLHAMTMLADCYVHGVGVAKNSAEAFRLYSDAVNKGYGDAMGNLGVLYINGDGVNQDPKRAFDLFQSGAKQGNATCMYFLARSLESGTGIDPNPMEAAGWYKKAAQAGNRKAVEWCTKNNIVIPQN